MVAAEATRGGDMALPQLQAGGQNIETVFTQMQTLWSALISPIIDRPQNRSNILPKVALVIGQNTINHGLAGPLAGWNIVRIRAAAQIYDDQDTNPTPQKTLILVSDAVVTVDLEVF